MKPEGSLLHSQASATRPYPGPTQSRVIYRNKNKSNVNGCQMLEWHEEAFMESARNGTQEKFEVQNILYRVYHDFRA
jgi:hypothetical protein